MLAVVVGAAAAPAAAAPAALPRPSRRRPWSNEGHQDHHRFGAGRQFRGCGLSGHRYGYRGTLLCGADALEVEWSPSRVEFFGIATDRTIWHVWRTAAGGR
jgi:hypothetical protein